MKTMNEEKIYFENQGQKIESILHKPGGETDSLIILVHGFTGSKEGPGDAFIKLAEELVSRNFAVLRFNFRFTTDDWSEFQKMTVEEEVSDLKLIINEMSKYYEKIGLVGESLGGAVVILSYNERIKCLVLWYPVIFKKETIQGKKFLSEQSAQELEKTGFVKGRKSNGKEYKVGKEFIEELKILEIIPSAKKISSPTFLIHGDKDNIVPFNQSQRLLNVLKGPKKLEKIKDICHAWKNEDGTTNYNLKAQQKVIQLTIEWFEKWLK